MFSAVAGWCEAGLAAALFVLPPLLALAPRAAAALCGFAGLCAAGSLFARKVLVTDGAIAYFGAVLGAMAIWAALSAVWSIDPGRSLILDIRLIGLFTATLALATSAGSLPDPGRYAMILMAGTGVAIVLAWIDLMSAGGLSQYFSTRNFAAPRLNQIAVWLTLLVYPATAWLYLRRWPILAMALATAMAGSVFELADTTAKLALAIGATTAALLFVWRPPVARLAAVLSVLAILMAPLVLPRLAHDVALFSRVDTYKESAGHRLLIWSFVGDHIAEHPLRGWGLDTSRAIPGGSVDARPGEKWLPLHPHNSALQVWLELGLPGALLFALLIGGLWWRLGSANWPRLYAAAAGGSLAAALTVAVAGWGIWAEWWLGTLALAIFATLLMARAVERSGSQPSTS